MTTTSAATVPRSTHPLRAALRRWPTVAGVVMAAFVAWGATSGADTAPVLAASGFVYLGSAAFQKRGAAWPVFFLSFVVIGAAGFTAFEAPLAIWALVAIGVGFAAFGLLRGAARPAEGLPLQSLAMAGFGGLAVAVLLVGGDLGLYLVAAGLLGHAAWDVWHHRTERVVSRSLAEFCVVLDTLVAVAMIAVALQN
ncbi:hypothetical protein [Glycomyces algeriensis]|uniref:Uncharacterized protein n=1 Tax=Glycomyces algeriensis TaxID=256037 RepID=A0A9W6GAX1_9ACTN|nr:hypothetical protein [Glycomyces algeriensis]MDA1364677.1 hypothetical protein [Glycomyces algeriensis]MDR7350717.1 hypothetical protein [Glycomyces algeriensis]GLI43428.1 hypothetical protein GALLR39Z86_32780 [Glycomyces algeriensis]